MFGRKRQKQLEARAEFENSIDTETLKDEPFIVEPDEVYPMVTSTAIIGKVTSGMYEVVTPIGIETAGQIIHSKKYSVTLPGTRIPKEDIGTVYKGDTVGFIFEDIMSRILDKEIKVKTSSWNELHSS